MAHDVFLSYSSKDKFAADAACAVLERAGIRVWMAPRDILPGMEWGASIIAAINTALVMVLVFSGNANESKQVRLEVERAINKGLPLIPFRIEDVEPGDALELFISSSHWLDAFTKPLEEHLDHLAEVVRLLIETKYGKVRPPTGTDVRAQKVRPRPEQAKVAIQPETSPPEGPQTKVTIPSDATGAQGRRGGLLAFGVAALISLVAVGGYFWRAAQEVAPDLRSPTPSTVVPLEPTAGAAPVQAPLLPAQPSSSASLTPQSLVPAEPVGPPAQSSPVTETPEKENPVVIPAPLAPRASPKVVSPKPKPKALAHIKPQSTATAPSKAKCFMFNDEKFCE